MNTSGFKPMKYNVLVLPEKVEEKTAGGIFLPEQAKEKHEFEKARGLLIAVGSLAFTDPDWLDCPKVGDRILYNKFAGQMVKGIDGDTYRIFSDKEVMAVIYE